MSKLEQIFDNLTIAQKALIDNLKAQIEILESEGVVVEIRLKPGIDPDATRRSYEFRTHLNVSEGPNRLTRIR